MNSPRKIESLRQAIMIWESYCRYGLKPFYSPLTMKEERVERNDVLASLQFPQMKIAAENFLIHYKSKIKEVELMLEELE